MCYNTVGLTIVKSDNITQALRGLFLHLFLVIADHFRSDDVYAYIIGETLIIGLATKSEKQGINQVELLDNATILTDPLFFRG